MLNSTEISAADLLLQNADFPDNYVNMQHPDDYTLVDDPFVTYIPHFYGHHNRLIVRVCWKANNKYIPMSFVCDTGAPMGLYISDTANALLRRHNRVIEEEDTGNEYAVVQNVGKSAVEPTPPGHAPANIIGLRLLIKLGLSLHTDSSFSFTNMPTSF